MAVRSLVAGNWKMNGLAQSASELQAVMASLASQRAPADVMICPPFTLIDRFVTAATGSAVAIGGQDCHAKASGAHTGDVSAPMLADLGASAVIVGHSERRTDHGESDAQVRAKQEASHSAGLLAIVCVGETEAQRDAGQALAVVASQLAGSLGEGTRAANTAVAYEPVWAIGTGRTPSSADIVQMHDHMRALLVSRFGADANGIRLLYGGSVKPGNAAEILSLSNVDGALVGGASLKADDLLAIARAAPTR